MYVAYVNARYKYKTKRARERERNARAKGWYCYVEASAGLGDTYYKWKLQATCRSDHVEMPMTSASSSDEKKKTKRICEDRMNVRI